MAEGSTANPGDTADEFHDGPGGRLDSWISRKSRLLTDQPESSNERRMTVVPQVPESAYGEPEQAYLDDQQTQELRKPTGANPGHEDAYAAPRGGPDQPESDEALPRHLRPEASPQPASRRLGLILGGGLAAGGLLCTALLVWGLAQPSGGSEAGSAVTTASPDLPYGTATRTELPSAAASSPGLPSPSARRSATPSARPSTTASATSTPRVSQGPVLFGPSDRSGVKGMAQQYCESRDWGSAKARSDGDWQCWQISSAHIVDMDAACRDTYGSAAYARTLDTGDPYAWRCYR